MRLAGDRHVVGVHHAVDEPDEHPLRDERRLRVDDALEEREVRVLGVGRVGVVAGDRVVGEPPHERRVVVRRRVLERADAQVARRDARRAPRPAASARARSCSPVATTASARVVGMPRACIASPITYSRSIGPTAALPSPPRANGVRPEPFRCRSRRRPCDVEDLAEQQRAPVAEPGREPAELVARVGLRHRRRTVGRRRCRRARPRPRAPAAPRRRRPSSAASSSLSTSSRGAGDRRRLPRLVQPGQLADEGVVEREQRLGRRRSPHPG